MMLKHRELIPIDTQEKRNIFCIEPLKTYTLTNENAAIKQSSICYCLDPPKHCNTCKIDSVLCSKMNC